MNLKKISIENFKCFGKQVDIDFGRLTLLTGANSSGKSSIIYSILGAIQSGEFPFQFSPNGEYINMGNFKDVVHNHKREEKIRLDFEFEKSQIKKVKTIWSENIKNNLPDLLELYVEADYFKLSIKKTKAGKYSASFNYDLVKDPIHRVRGTDLRASKNIVIEGFEFDYFPIPNPKNQVTVEDLENICDDVMNLFFDYEEQINFISPFRLLPERDYYEQSKTKLRIGSTGDGYLDQIIYWETNKDPQLKTLVQNIKKLKLLHSFKAKRIGGGKYEILVKAKKNGIETSLSDVGSGVSHFLPIMVADLQLPDDSTLYVAEPESHLHPSVQSSVGDYFVNQIAATSKNYVVETHSEYLLNKIRLAIVKAEIKQDDVKVLFIDNEGDENVIHNITFNTKGQIINAPKNFFKTYMMDVMEIAINAAE